MADTIPFLLGDIFIIPDRERTICNFSHLSVFILQMSVGWRIIYHLIDISGFDMPGEYISIVWDCANNFGFN